MAWDVIYVPVVPSNYLGNLIHPISKESTFKFETLNFYSQGDTVPNTEGSAHIYKDMGSHGGTSTPSVLDALKNDALATPQFLGIFSGEMGANRDKVVRVNNAVPADSMLTFQELGDDKNWW